MAQRKDLTGIRFSRLLVLGRGDNDRRGQLRWRCECDCGSVTHVLTRNLNNGNSRSCGCLTKERCPVKHGLSRSPIHYVWTNMKQRCNNPNNPGYKNYGSRGVAYHPSFETFEGFLAGLPEGYSRGLELDRIDNDGNYEPGNLRWATRLIQANNRQNTRYVGEKSIAEIAREIDVHVNTLRNRISESADMHERRPSSLPRSLIREVRDALWSMEPEDVAIWYDLPVSTVMRIRQQDIYATA